MKLALPRAGGSRLRFFLALGVFLVVVYLL